MTFRSVHGVAWLSLLLLVSAGRGSVSHDAVQAKGKSESSEARSEPQPLTSDGESVLHSVLDAGELSDLERPNFSSYQNDVRAFYQAFGDRFLGFRKANRLPRQWRSSAH